MPELLEVKNLTKRFGGVVAVSDATLSARAGEVTSLIGPNGAGKTTLFNMITGVYKPTSGEVVFDGKPIGGLRCDKIIARGVARTFQNIRLFSGMSVLDNVRVGLHGHLRANALQSWLRAPGMRTEEAAATAASLELLEFVGLKRKACEPAGSLPYGEQRLLEIARALACGPKLLLLDEPAAGMNPSETEDLMDLIRRLLELKISVLLIEHDMKLVMRISDTVHVLDHGEIIASGTPEEARANPRVVEAYLGHSAGAHAAAPAAVSGDHAE